MGKISVDAFLREYSVAVKQKGTAMESFIKKHIVVNYIPFIQKQSCCEGIARSTCYKKVGERDMVSFDSCARYLVFIMKLIEFYTDIKIDDNIVIAEYDKLNEVGAISAIISAIPKSEYSEFSTILNMKIDDIRDNEYSLTALIYNFKEGLSISEEVINSAIKELIKEQDNNE